MQKRLNHSRCSGSYTRSPGGIEMRGLQGKVALVTGGTGLIGGATCVRLAEEGVSVGVASRSIEKARNWCAEHDMANLHPLQLDVADANSIKTCFDEMAETCGLPEILVASAVPLEALPFPIEELTHEHFSRLYEVDVAGNFLCARTLVERLEEGRTGSIVWLSSIYGSAGVKHDIYPEGMMHSPVHYSSTKAAVQGTVRYLAGLWGEDGVRVNAVVSGGVRSEARQNDEFVRRYSRRTMLGRMAEPDELASSIAFLASDDASYITGTCLDVEGGLLAW